MKLNLNKNVIGLDGQEMPDTNLAKLLARFLSSKGDPFDPVKAIDWARALYKDGVINIDRSDLDKLSQYIKTQELMTIAKEAMLSVITGVLNDSESN